MHFITQPTVLLLLLATLSLVSPPLANAQNNAQSNVPETCFSLLSTKDYSGAEASARQQLKAEDLAANDEYQAQICLGQALYQLNRFNDALKPLLRAGKLSQSVAEKAAACDWLGKVHESLGKPSLAEAQYQCASAAYKELGDSSKAAEDMNSVAMMRVSRGNVDQALEAYREALHLEPEDAKKPPKLNNIAMILSNRGKHADAAQLLRQAQEILEQQENKQHLAIIQINLGETLRQLGDLPGADAELQAGLSASQIIGDKRWEAKAYRLLGRLRFDQKNLAEAKDFMRRAIELSSASGRVDQIAIADLEFFNKQKTR